MRKFVIESWIKPRYPKVRQHPIPVWPQKDVFRLDVTVNNSSIMHHLQYCKQPFKQRLKLRCVK